MNPICIITLGVAMLIASPTLGAAENRQSKYVGQEHREIKSLSADDIAELRSGQGWGMAKVAELNGVPGPAHLLELKDDIPLSDEQYQLIDSIFNEMRSAAVLQGQKLIELESVLDKGFKNKSITQERLRALLDKIAQTQSDLRYIHLSTHLQMLPVLSKEQIEKYNTLRGYANAKCETPPSGHDPAMWRQHNSCN